MDTNAAHVDQVKRGLTRRQTKLVAGVILLAVVSGYLIYSAARGTVAYYVTVSELQARDVSNRDVRVAGTVLEGSIDWDPTQDDLRFTLVDAGGDLAVHHGGPRPDMLRDGAEVVIEGRLSADGTFDAHTLILKCPSKYVEAD